MSVSYNKMSAIKIAGSYVNNVPSGTPLGNVSLDVTGKSHFTSDNQIDGNLILLSDASFNSRLFINGDVSMNSKLSVSGDASFNNIYSSVVPTTGNMLCNKTYVDAAVGGGSILGLNNTFTGINTFSNANTIISGNTVTNSIQSSDPTTNINIGTQLTTGDINLGTVFISTPMNVALNWGNGSNSGQLTFRGGSFTLASSGIYSQSSGATFATNISTNQTDGVMNIGTGARTALGEININTNSSTLGAVKISSTATGNAPITIGSTASSTQTCAMDAITTFSKIPSCAVAPTTANHLCNKTYVDAAVGGGSILGTNNTFTGTNTFNNTIIGGADVSFNSRLFINGDVSLNSKLSVSGDVSMNSRLFINGDVSLNSKLMVNGDVSMNSRLFINGDVSLNSKLSVSGDASFNNIFSSVVPTSGNMLCNKTYVDSVAGGVSLSSNNTWTGTNTFNNTLIGGADVSFNSRLFINGDVSMNSKLTIRGDLSCNNAYSNILKLRTPQNDPYTTMDLYCAEYNGITMNGAPGATFAFANANLNTNTLTVPINNNQSLIKVKIPINIAGFGAPIFYFGQLDVIFLGVTSITILRNGSLHKNVSISYLSNSTGNTKSWTGWSEKGKNGRAYLGDLEFEIPLSTGNISVDTYTIGMALDVSVNAAAGLYVSPAFLCQGDANFTQTHATNTVGTTYISTDPASFYPPQITFGNIGSYITASDSMYLRASSFIELKSSAGIDLRTRGGTINLLASQEGGAGELNLKTLGTGDLNIQSGGAMSISAGGGTLSTYTSGNYNVSADGIAAIAITGSTSIITPNDMVLRGDTSTTIGYNGTSTTTIEGSIIQIRSSLRPLYTATPGANVNTIGCRVVVPFTSSTASAVTTIYTQNNFPIGVWIVEIKTTFSYASAPPAGAWYRIGTSGAAGSFNDPTRVCDFNPNSSGQQNCHFTTTYQFSGSSPLYVIQQHSGTTITTPTNGSYVSYTRIG